MNEAAMTLEGWYALHDFRTINWPAWKAADEEVRAFALDELNAFREEWDAVEAAQKAVPLYIPSSVRKPILYLCFCARRWKS